MVSIVMPAYNEAEIIELTVREWCNAVIDKLPGSELIVVDDCSTDGTGAVLEAAARRLPALRVVRPPQNGGHGKALRFGFQHARNAITFQTDSDRQHLPEDFWKLWNLRERHDFIFGVRTSREDGAFRLFVTRIMRTLNWLAWGLWIRDANCPFKLMKTAALRDVLERIPPDSFIPMVMVSILARKAGYPCCDVPVRHLPRTGGQQSLKGVLKWVRVGSRCARQLLELRMACATGRTPPAAVPERAQAQGHSSS